MRSNFTVFMKRKRARHTSRQTSPRNQTLREDLLFGLEMKRLFLCYGNHLTQLDTTQTIKFPLCQRMPVNQNYMSQEKRSHQDPHRPHSMASFPAGRTTSAWKHSPTDASPTLHGLNIGPSPSDHTMSLLTPRASDPTFSPSAGVDRWVSQSLTDTKLQSGYGEKRRKLSSEASHLLRGSRRT